MFLKFCVLFCDTIMISIIHVAEQSHPARHGTAGSLHLFQISNMPRRPIISTLRCVAWCPVCPAARPRPVAAHWTDPTIHRPSSGQSPSASWPVPLTRLENKAVDTVASCLLLLLPTLTSPYQAFDLRYSRHLWAIQSLFPNHAGSFLTTTTAQHGLPR